VASIREQELALQAKLREVRQLAVETCPITKDMAASAPTWRAAYSDRTSALMAALCLIAYDHFEDTSGTTLETMRIRLAKGGFKLINTYNPKNSTQAYLAVSDEFAVLAFRGTTDITDWRSNLDAGLMPLDPERPLVRVHRGFLQAFREVEDEIEADLAKHVPDSLGFYITGHSLGGALAQIAAAALARDNLAACYTFGSPRVSGKRFDEQVRCPHYRVVNAADIVPGVPPPVWRGYYHNGDVRWLNRSGDPPKRFGRRITQEFIKSVVAIFVAPFTRNLKIIEDHMIWNYEAKLSAVADARAPIAPSIRTEVDEAEVRARFQLAAFRAARHCGVHVAEDVRPRFAELMAAAAAAVIADSPLGQGREPKVVLGEQLYARLIEDMAALAKQDLERPDDMVNLALLDLSLVTLGGFAPYW
jgi:hypothetical protein